MPCDKFTAVMLAELVGSLVAGAVIPGIGIGVAFAGVVAFIVIVAGMILIELHEQEIAPEPEIEQEPEATVEPANAE